MTFTTLLLKHLTKEKVSLFVIIILFAVGLYGINFSNLNYFASLTPIIIGFGGFLVIANTQTNLLNYIYLVFVFLVGFFIEVIGVKTGMIFGWYTYKENLGLKWFDVPLLMGINWLSLIYGSAMLGFFISRNMFWQWFWAAFFMLLLDVFIEPQACKLGYWCWNNASMPPPQNFAAWFIVSFLLAVPFRFLKHENENRFAAFYFIVQLTFFMLLNLMS